MKNKVILITGATSGIGRVSAEKFAKLGHTVLIHGRSKAKVDQTISEIKEATGNENLIGYIADLSKISEVKDLSTKVKNDFEEMDVLINNAGLGPNHKEIFAVNYIATVSLTLDLLPLVKKVKGRILNISSAAQGTVDFENFMQATGMDAYSQSKLAVIQFSNYMAKEIEQDGVNVYSLDPGSFLSTKMVKETWGREGRDINIGADAHIKLALSEDLSGETGQFYCEGELAQAHPDATNLVVQNKLWELTQKYI